MEEPTTTSDDAGSAALDKLAEQFSDAMSARGGTDVLTTTARARLCRHLGMTHSDPGVDPLAELLTVRLRLDGPSHHDTIAARLDLQCYGRGTTASLTFTRIYDDLHAARRRQLGGEHPDTLRARESAACAYGFTGYPETAIIELEATLAVWLRFHRSDHAGVRRCRGLLGLWLAEADYHTRAASVYQELLDEQLHSLGENHPNVLRTRADLAFCRGVTDGPGCAADLAGLLADFLRLYGPAHCGTSHACLELAGWLYGSNALDYPPTRKTAQSWARIDVAELKRIGTPPADIHTIETEITRQSRSHGEHSTNGDCGITQE